MSLIRRSLTIAAISALGRPIAAQTTPAATVPVRVLPAPTAESAESFGALAALRHLPNGNLLVNDQGRRRVLMLDSTMKTIAVVIDSTSGREGAYGPRPGALFPFRGDSAVFFDPTALSMLVIDPAGKVARVMAAPTGPGYLVGAINGLPGVDANGRLIYRGSPAAAGGPPGGGQFMARGGGEPDTTPLVAFNLATRQLDTVAFYHIPKSRFGTVQMPNGETRMAPVTDPLPIVDAWAVMPDGAIAILRGREYRVEFIDASGKRTVAEKLPFDWAHLSEQDKVTYLDSARASIERQREQELARIRAAGDTTATGAPRGSVTGPPNFVAPSELPDYKPAFGQGGLRADEDGHLWVRPIPTRLVPGGPLYDVIGRDGKLAGRVQIPAGMTIAGFGKGGIVYTARRDASGTHLQRSRLTWP